jgi:MFS family permease
VRSAPTTDLAAPRPHATRSLLVLGLGAMSFALAQSTLLPALPDLARAFHTDASGAAWTFTGYLLSAAVFTPLFGRMGDMYGKRLLLVLALVVFALGNVVSAFGHTLGVVVAGRVLQGTAGGIFPLSFGIIRDEFPPNRVRVSIGLISATVGLGGGLGLVVGGLLLDHLGYHAIFWTGAALAAVAAAATLAWIPESPHRTMGRIDLRGAAILVVGLVLPLVAISQARSWGWTGARTLLMIAAGLAVLALWVAVERRTAEPLANIASLSRRPVLLTNLVTLLLGFTMLGAFTLVPQLAQAPTSTGYGFGLSATPAGLLLVPGTLAMLAVGPLSGMLSERVGSRLPLGLGCLVTAVGIGLVGVAHGTQLAVLLFSLLAFAGIGLAYAAMPNLIVDAVPRHETGEATGFNAVTRTVGASLGGQVCASILAASAVGAGAAPTEGAFRIAFLACAGVGLVAAALSILIPSVVAAADLVEEVQAASPLAEPAYVRE